MEDLKAFGAAKSFAFEAGEEVADAAIGPFHRPCFSLALSEFFTFNQRFVCFPVVGGKSLDPMHEQSGQKPFQGFFPTRTQFPGDDPPAVSIHSNPKPDLAFFYRANAKARRFRPSQSSRRKTSGPETISRAAAASVAR